MRRLLMFVALVVVFGAVLTPASAAAHPGDDAMPVVVGGPAVIAEDTVLEIEALGWESIRLYGKDRYATAAAVALESRHDPDFVFVATGLNFPDALAGAPAAFVHEAPILLVTRTNIPAATAGALADLSPRTIYVLGGPAAVSEAVVDALGGYAMTVERVFGPTRYHTAAAVSKRFFPTADSQPGVYIATGENYPDALAAGGIAGKRGTPILLVEKDRIPAVTAAELDRLDPEWIVVLGGPAAVSQSVVADLRRYASDFLAVVAGANRYETAAELSSLEWISAGHPMVTTGENFPDALTAGARGTAVLLTRKHSLPASAAAELKRLMNAAVP